MTDSLSKMQYANNTADAAKLNAIYAANPQLFDLPKGAEDTNGSNCTTSSALNFLYLPTIRGGRKMNGGCGCGMRGGMSESDDMIGGMSESGEYSGGCFTCKRGKKNITHVYSSIHILIPKLYNKYNNERLKKAVKTMKANKVIKKSKY
jgi:hypothetical protein